MVTLYIVRHGETEWNVKGLMQGHKDSPLTKNGVKQASQLAKELHHIHFDKVFSSDLLRTQRTAEIITLEKALAIETTKALRERCFGKFEGQPLAQFNKLFTRWDEMSQEEKYSHKPSDDSESIGEVLTRFITFIREVAVAYEGKTVLLVTHGGLMRYFLIHLGYWTDNTNERLGNASYIKLESDGTDFFIKELKGIIKP